MKKLIAASTVVVALLVGPAAGLAGAADAPKPRALSPEVITSVLGAVDQKLDEAVANGQLDAARADRIKDRLQQRATKLANGEHTPRLKARRVVRRHIRRAAVVLAAKTIGVEPMVVVDARRDGKSVADVARANDVEPQTVIDALLTAATKRIDEAVANGKIDERRATTAKDRLPERVDHLVNATGSVHPAK